MKGKYMVTFDITFKGSADPRQVRRSDHDIRELLGALRSVDLPKLSDIGSGRPTVIEINRFLTECRTLFVKINQFTTLLNNPALKSFATDGWTNLNDMHHTVTVKPAAVTLPRTPVSASSSETQDEFTPENKRTSSAPTLVTGDLEACFITLDSNSTSGNRFNTFQIDISDAMTLADSKALGASGSSKRISSIFSTRSSKYFGSLKDIARISGSSDTLSKSRISEEARKSGSSDTLNPKRQSGLMSMFSGNSGTDPKLDRSLTTAGSSSTLKRQKKPNGQQTLERKQTAKKFETFLQTQIEQGYVKVSEDTIALQENGKDLVVIKMIDGIPRIIAATLDKLVEISLTDQPVTDPQFAKCFLLTYRHFTKPHELLIMLIEKYKATAVKSVDNGHTEIIQMQVASYLQMWIQVSYDDFDRDPTLREGFDKFIDIVKTSKKVVLMAEQILNLAKAKVSFNCSQIATSSRRKMKR
jgi:hypothetical protein